MFKWRDCQNRLISNPWNLLIIMRCLTSTSNMLLNRVIYAYSMPILVIWTVDDNYRAYISILTLQTISQALATAREHLTRTLLKWYLCSQGLVHFDLIPFWQLALGSSICNSFLFFSELETWPPPNVLWAFISIQSIKIMEIDSNSVSFCSIIDPGLIYNAKYFGP